MQSRIDRGRSAFGERVWAVAYTELSTADKDQPLESDDLERLATAAYLLGLDADAIAYWTRAHHVNLQAGSTERATRCTFWLAFVLLHLGEPERAFGWLSRGKRFLDECALDCVEQGYLLFPIAYRSIVEGDNAAAHQTFRDVAAIASRFGDADLVTLARHGEGRALIRMGRTDDGIELLDEVMIAVTTGEVSPVVAGDVYCSVIEACHEILDLHRASAWTDALNQWCESQPDLVAYRGNCLVRRAEIMQLHGSWSDAIREAQMACERLSQPSAHPAIADAYYQLAELYRLRGEFERADEAYREVSHRARSPQPGLALLRLAQGQTEVAYTTIRYALEETRRTGTRSKLLAAFVDIALAAGDVVAAREGAAEMSGIASRLEAPYVRALSAFSTGAVLLAQGKAHEALQPLQHALALWLDLSAPHEIGRTRVLIGIACRAMGDRETAAMEFEAARRVFQELGAVSDLARVESLGETPSSAGANLTPREAQVLQLLAMGKTNRTLAKELHISEKTVARHVSNIFVKLGVSTRAAATAYAYDHGLVKRRT